MRGVAHGSPQLLVDVVLVEPELVQHADEEAVLLLGVVLALVGAVGDAQLVEGGTVAGDLGIQGLSDGVTHTYALVLVARNYS